MREKRYSISHKMHLIDNAPMEQDKLPLVWDPERKIWKEGGVTVAEHLDAVPISEDEAKEVYRKRAIFPLKRCGGLNMSTLAHGKTLMNKTIKRQQDEHVGKSDYDSNTGAYRPAG